MPNRVINLILTHPDELEVEFDAFPKWLQILLPAKGQIISEGNWGVLNFPKKQLNYFKDFFPKMGQIKKSKSNILL